MRRILASWRSHFYRPVRIRETPGVARPEKAALPGGDMPARSSMLLSDTTRRYPLSTPVAMGYGRRYGTRSRDLRAARFLIAEERETRGEDILTRRTKHGLHLSDSERQAFGKWFAGIEASSP
jgi:D-erythritol 1-phosphate dehydrogenase